MLQLQCSDLLLNVSCVFFYRPVWGHAWHNFSWCFPLKMTQQQMWTIKWQLQPLQVGLESLQRSWRVISYSTYFCLLINQRQLTCRRWLECPVIIPPTSSVLILLGLWQFWLHSVPMPFVTTPSSMMCLPRGPTTISLLLTSLSKLLSARWWSPV